MNIVSPYGRVIRYEVPPLKGFFLHPKSDAADSGWTATKGESGELKIPGDPGGSGTYRFVGKKTGTPAAWRTVHTPGDFFYGEIDWVGSEKNVAIPSHGRYRLSYHGPNTRYFGTDSFSYGSSDTHNNVYMEGRCITVAPGPVLGAALRLEDAELTPEEELAGVVPQKVPVVVVVCFMGDSEHVYRRTLPSIDYGVTRRLFTDAFRAAEMRLHDEEEAPEGWYLIGSFSLTTAAQFGGAVLGNPRVPWFFNRSGTEAVCVRECDTTITISGTEENQKSYNKFQLSLSTDAYVATASDEGQAGPGFAVRIETLLARKPDWVNTTPWPTEAAPTLEHAWAVVKLTQTLTMNGYLIVAADYDGDTQVSVKYEIDHHRTQNHYCYKGIDNRSAFIGAGNGDYANTEELYGDMVYAFNFPPDAGTVNEPYGVTIPVTKTNETAYLVLPNNDRHYVYRKFTGTKAEYDTGELNPDDVIAYFEFFLAVYPHVLDIRQPYMAAFIDHVVYQGYEETLKNRYRMEQYFDGKAEEYIPIAEIQDAQASVPFIYVGFDFTKVWADTEAIAQGEYVWETPDVVEYVVLDGRWYMEGMSEVEWPSTVPNPADYRRNSLVVKLDTHMDTVHEILQSVLNGYRNLGSGVDDFGNRALSLEYRDDKGDAKYFNYLEDGDLDLLTGATGGNTRYFNIGVS